MIYGTASGRSWVAASGRRPIQKLDTGDSPLALWLFEGTITDSSGGGYHWSQDGTGRWTSLHGLQATAQGISTSRLSSTASALRLTGDMSLIWQGVIDTDIGTASTIVLCSGVGETEATNALWQLNIDTAGSVVVGHEYGSGTNQNLTASDWLIPNRATMTLGFTRSGTTSKIFLNGQMVASGTLTAPSGGSSANTYLGSNGDSAYYPVATLSLGIYSSALSDSLMSSKMLRMLGYS